MTQQSVSVRFVGSGDAFGSGGRFQTCLLVQGSVTLLVDCGATSLVALKRAGVVPNDIETIAISHLHGDHFGGIPFFLLDAQLSSRRSAPLAIVGPVGVEARVRDAMEALFPGSSRVERKFEVRYLEIEPEAPREVGGVLVTGFPVVHFSGAPPLALRIAIDGRIVTYSGDTEWTESLVSASRDADLFVCETYFFEKHVKYHLDYRTLLTHRDRLTCKRMVLTHMSEDMLSRLESLDPETETAHDGMVVTL